MDLLRDQEQTERDDEWIDYQRLEGELQGIRNFIRSQRYRRYSQLWKRCRNLFHHPEQAADEFWSEVERHERELYLQCDDDGSDDY